LKIQPARDNYLPRTAPNSEDTQGQKQHIGTNGTGSRDIELQLNKSVDPPHDDVQANQKGIPPASPTEPPVRDTAAVLQQRPSTPALSSAVNAQPDALAPTDTPRNVAQVTPIGNAGHVEEESEKFRYEVPQAMTLNINLRGDEAGNKKIPDYSLSISDNNNKIYPKTSEQKAAYQNLVRVTNEQLAGDQDSGRLWEATSNFIKSMNLEDGDVRINISAESGDGKNGERTFKAAVGIVYGPVKTYFAYSKVDEAKNLLSKTDVIDTIRGDIKIGAFENVKLKIGRTIESAVPGSIKGLAGDFVNFKNSASDWYHTNQKVQIALKVGGALYGALDLAAGTIKIFDAKDRDSYVGGAMGVANGGTAILGSVAELGILAGVGGEILPIVSAGAGIVGLGIFAGGQIINIISIVNNHNNISKSDNADKELSYEARQLKKADNHLEAKIENLPSDIVKMESDYDLKIKSVHINNSGADYINSVNSNGNSSHGAEPRGSNAPGDDHHAEFNLHLDQAKPMNGAGRQDEEKNGSTKNDIHSLGDSTSSNGPWEPATTTRVSKSYGYTHSTLFDGSDEIIKNNIHAGDPYLTAELEGGGDADLVVIDDVETSPPLEKSYPKTAGTDRSESTNDGWQSVNKKYENNFNYKTNIEYHSNPRSRQGQSKAGVSADNLITNCLNDAIDAYHMNPDSVRLPAVPATSDPNAWKDFVKKLSDINSNRDKRKYEHDWTKIYNLSPDDAAAAGKSAIEWAKKNRGIDISKNYHLARSDAGNFLRDVFGTYLQNTNDDQFPEWNRNSEAGRDYVKRVINTLRDRGFASVNWAETQSRNLAKLTNDELDMTLQPALTMASLERARNVGEAYTVSRQKEDLDPRPHVRTPDNFSRQIVTKNPGRTVVSLKNNRHDVSIYAVGNQDIVRVENFTSKVTIHVGGNSDTDTYEGFLDLRGGLKVDGLTWGVDGRSVTLTMSNGQSIELRALEKKRLERFLRKSALSIPRQGDH